MTVQTVDSSAAVSSPLGSENEDAEVLGKVFQSSLSVKKSKEASVSKKGTLVQATLSTLFGKVAEKVRLYYLYLLTKTKLGQSLVSDFFTQVLSHLKIYYMSLVMLRILMSKSVWP